MMQFIVTTSAAGSSRSQLWNPALPLALGHPFRWIAERTKTGVRIRGLSAKAGEVLSEGICEISNERLQSGAEIALPQSSGVSIRIRPVREMRPAFSGNTGDKLSIFACNGSWVLRSALFEERYQAVSGKDPIFSLREKSGTYALDIHVSGLKIQTGDEPASESKQGEAIHIPSAEMGDTVLILGTLSWRFGFSQNVSLPTAPLEKNIDAETEWFRKALRYAVVGLGAFVVMSWFWPVPKPDTKELIPAQFAKIVLTKPQSSKASAASEAASSSAVPEKVQKAAVVQAFRAKALSSAVSGLLKGGMTSLLAQSDFVSGNKASADARRIFDAKSTSLQSTGPATGLAANTNVNVGAVGGTGKGGYGKGEHAGVQGQGQAFVSMDIAGASVDEGLTKDEVGEVIHRHISEVRYCYESAMVRTPDIEGKLMVAFTIGGNGMVKSTEIKSSTLPDPRLDDCILRRLTTWKFPNPRGGIDVAVAYPFIFKTLGR